MPKTKKISGKSGLPASRAFIVLVVACAAVLAIIFIANVTGTGSGTLPSKYLRITGTGGSEPIYFNGINPGEGNAVLHRGETVDVRMPDIFGNDIYIALGDPPNGLVVATVKPKTANLDTKVTIPKDLNIKNKFGLVPFHIYYTILSGDTEDNWVMVQVLN